MLVFLHKRLPKNMIVIRSGWILVFVRRCCFFSLHKAEEANIPSINARHVKVEASALKKKILPRSDWMCLEFHLNWVSAKRIRVSLYLFFFFLKWMKTRLLSAFQGFRQYSSFSLFFFPVTPLSQLPKSLLVCWDWLIPIHQDAKTLVFVFTNPTGSPGGCLAEMTARCLRG